MRVGRSATRINRALCKHGATFHLIPEWKMRRYHVNTPLVSSFQSLISPKKLRKIELQMLSAILFGWFVCYYSTLIPTGTNGKHPHFPKFVSMKFLKFATNLATSPHSCQSNRELRFHAEICWEVVKFVAREVCVIRCSWFGNITTNECKQSENICKPSNTS